MARPRRGSHKLLTSPHSVEQLSPNMLLDIAARQGRIQAELNAGKPTAIENDPVRWVEEVGACIETKTHGIVKFKPYDFQKQLMRAVASGEAYVIPKARQLGVSTAIVMAFCHQLLYRQTATGIPLHCHVIANKEEVAIERLLKVAKTALSTANLPEYQREHLENIDPKVNNNEVRYYTPEGQNYIRAHATGKSAGRSFDGNAALLEEFAYMPYAIDVWTSISPMLDDLEKAPVFIVSTYDTDGDLFCSFVDNARDLGLKCIPIDWRAHPVRMGNDNGKKWKTRSLKKFKGREDLWKREYELLRIAVGTRLVDIAKVEAHAKDIPFIGSRPIPNHRYSKGVDLSGPHRKGTVHCVIDISINPPQVVYLQAFSEQNSTVKIAAIDELDARWPGPLFIDGTHDAAIAAQVSARAKTAVRFRAASNHVTERIDRIENLKWKNVPRDMMMSWLGVNLEDGRLIVHCDEFPELYTALKTANRSTGNKELGENVDELDALLLANLSLTRSRRYDNSEDTVVGVESDGRLQAILGVRW